MAGLDGVKPGHPLRPYGLAQQGLSCDPLATTSEAPVADAVAEAEASSASSALSTTVILILVMTTIPLLNSLNSRGRQIRGVPCSSQVLLPLPSLLML